MPSEDIHISLLRPAIIHILRASGFHSCRPSVLDTLTDLCARHLAMIAQRTADQVYDRTSAASEDDLNRSCPPLESIFEHNIDASPTITDVRLALASVSFFNSTLTPAEEAWRERLRKPLSTYHAGARDKERRRRDAEDTADVREFVDWTTGPTNKEIRRIAGLQADEQDTGAIAAARAADGVTNEATVTKDDYLTALKKKHSKTGEEARYAGTVLGKLAEDKGLVKIEGGPESLSAWTWELKRRRGQADEEGVRAQKKPMVYAIEDGI